MVKAEDFLKFLCEDLNYRFFSGVPCLGFKSIYDKMSSKFMHYVPAVDEKTAFGICVGASISGAKSVVMVDAKYLKTAYEWLDLSKKIKSHVIILTNSATSSIAPFLKFNGDFEALKDFINKNMMKKVPCVIVLEEVV